MRPPKDKPMAEFEEFLDSIFDPLLAAAGVLAEQAVGTDDSEDSDTANSDSEDEEFEIEAILNKIKRLGRTELLVRWKGLDAKHNSWEPEEAVSADELLPAFEVA